MTDSTMAMSNFPQELVEEVISRVPLTSVRAVRTTCKKWNTLFKHRKHIRKSKVATKKKEFMAIMMMDSSVYLMSVNLHGILNDYDGGNNIESLINRKAKLMSLNGEADRVEILSVFHCSGLLLCLTKVKEPSLVVFNPYSGQTRCIKTRYRDDIIAHSYSFALGYEKKKNSPRSLKILRSAEAILRFIDNGYRESRGIEFQIYNFNSDSWRDITLTSNGGAWFLKCGVSLKGNTYWLARNHTNRRDTHTFCGCGARRQQLGGQVREIPEFFLLCFDFTTERFAPRLSLPFQSNGSNGKDTVTLSSVRDEQLALLFQRKDTLQMEIWITTKIEPEAVSWSKLFLAVDMKTLVTYGQFPFKHESFFVDEEKKVVVVFAKDKETKTRKVAYIIGEDEYFKKVDLGESSDKNGCPFVCSYVPSSVKIKQAAPQGNHID